eukprot:13247-Heterococcus_DN1.PRE.2
MSAHAERTRVCDRWCGLEDLLLLDEHANLHVAGDCRLRSAEQKGKTISASYACRILLFEYLAVQVGSVRAGALEGG